MNNNTDTKNISVIEWYPDPPQPWFGSGFSFLLVICALLGLLSSIASFTYITFFSKLNYYLKVVLGVYALELILCFIAALIGHIMMGFEMFQSLLTYMFFYSESNSYGILFINECFNVNIS